MILPDTTGPAIHPENTVLNKLFYKSFDFLNKKTMINYSFYLPQVVCIKEETPTASDLSSSDTHLDKYNSVRTNQCSNPMDKTSSVQNCSNLYIS